MYGEHGPLIKREVVNDVREGQVQVGQVDRTTSASTFFHKTIGFNRLARKIAIANLGGMLRF